MSEKKVVVITGASRGIGEAIAIRFGREEYRIVLVGRNSQDLHRVSDNILQDNHTETLVCAGDIADEKFTDSLIRAAVDKFGRIDVLVNNAAWRTVETMRTISRETWNKTMAVCITAPAFLAKASAEVMERLNIAGSIINISSVMSQRAGGNSPAYVACKGAMDSLTRELAVTYGRKGIRVTGVNPGNIDTDLARDYKTASGDDVSDRLGSYMVNATPLGRAGTPGEIAEVVYWLSTPTASFITGTNITVDGGFLSNLNEYSIKHLQFPGQF